jgi:hypothetical protein
VGGTQGGMLGGERRVVVHGAVRVGHGP